MSKLILIYINDEMRLTSKEIAYVSSRISFELSLQYDFAEESVKTPVRISFVDQGVFTKQMSTLDERNFHHTETIHSPIVRGRAPVAFGFITTTKLKSNNSK